MEAGRPVVPYVPFKTFLTALDALEAGLPNQLDRSVWPSYSGAIQGQLLGAFRFLGLMDEGNCPTPALGELVSKRGARRELLRATHRAPLPHPRGAGPYPHLAAPVG